MKILIQTVLKETFMTLKEYEALGAPGDNIPPGIDPEDWHSNRVVAAGGELAGRAVRHFLAPGQVADWGDDTYRLGLEAKSLGEVTEYTFLTIPKADLKDAADFTSVKDPFPPESKIVSLTATELEIAD